MKPPIQIALPEDFRDMLGQLVSCEVEFLLVGGLAFSTYGEPRATKDLDVWINPTPENARRLFRALAQFGAPAHGATEKDFAKAGTILQLGVPPVRIDLLTAIDGVQFPSAWSHQRTAEFADLPGCKVPVIAMEDMVANKELVARPQDLVDVAQIKKYMAKAKKE